MRVSMMPHPDSPSRAVSGIVVDVRRPHADTIELHYVAEGDMSCVRVPAPTEGGRRDELWRHTCFEVFLRPTAGETYVEFNFSPSTDHAGYAFAGYRKGMRGTDGATSKIRVQQNATRLELFAEIWTSRILGVDLSGALLARAFCGHRGQRWRKVLLGVSASARKAGLSSP